MSDIRMTGVNSIQSMDQWLKILAGNLTGSNVTGYKQQRVEFSDVLSKTMYGAAPSGDGGGAPLAAMAEPMGGSRIKAVKTDFSQGLLAESTRNTDLGINGEGFFILARTPNPTSPDDLVFTRDGSFRLDYVRRPSTPGSTKGDGDFYLVNQEGLYVMGLSGDKQNYTSGAANLPGFAQGPIAGKVTRDQLKAGTQVGGAAATAGSPAIAAYNLKPVKVYQRSNGLPGELRNTNISDETIKFDERGGLQVDGDVTRGETNGDPEPIFVALAKFQSRDGLSRTGSGSLYAWTPAAGDDVYIGAGGSNGPTGANFGFDGTQILGRRLESSNSSVNTTLPEMTIAQKSFTASVKIIQVGNALIDDVNNLVR